MGVYNCTRGSQYIGASDNIHGKGLKGSKDDGYPECHFADGNCQGQAVGVSDGLCSDSIAKNPAIALKIVDQGQLTDADGRHHNGSWERGTRKLPESVVESSGIVSMWSETQRHSLMRRTFDGEQDKGKSEGNGGLLERAAEAAAEGAAELQAMRAVRAACHTDKERLCGALHGLRGVRQCMHSNRHLLSDACKVAMEAGRVFLARDEIKELRRSHTARPSRGWRMTVVREDEGKGGGSSNENENGEGMAGSSRSHDDKGGSKVVLGWGIWSVALAVIVALFSGRIKQICKQFLNFTARLLPPQQGAIAPARKTTMKIRRKERQARNQETCERLEAAKQREVKNQQEMASVLRQQREAARQREKEEEERRKDAVRKVQRLRKELLSAERDAQSLCSTSSTELYKVGATEGTFNLQLQPCVICLDRPPVVVVVPCGHRCLCEEDAAAVMRKPKQQRECPICRTPVKRMQRVFD